MRQTALAFVVFLVAWHASAIAAADLPGCEKAIETTAAHPLACRAFSSDGATLDWDVLVERIASAHVALFGEVHDNPHHHRVRGQMILAVEAMRADRRRPALVLEHIRADQSLALAAFRALERKQRSDSSDIFKALAWGKSGWPDQALFRSLFEAALDAEWPILPGNPATADVRAVARQGLSSLEPDEVTRLGLRNDLPASLATALLEELEASHCGLMPKAAFARMAEAQRYRDAYMARAVADAAETYGRSILLAGNGHVRRDRGVPWHLRQIAPSLTTLAITMVEAEETKQKPMEYTAQEGRNATSDVTIITPRALRPDACEEMRRQFKR